VRGEPVLSGVEEIVKVGRGIIKSVEGRDRGLKMEDRRYIP
jgi:hypothetical protein